MLRVSIFSWDKKRMASLAMASAAVAAVALGGSIAAAPTFASPADTAPTATSKFGMVDINRVARESKLQQQYNTEFEQLRKNLASTLQRLDQGSGRFLTTSEINEIAGLYQKEKPTEAEQKRIGQLEDKGDKLKREFTTLQGTASPTDVQTSRLNTLNDMQVQGNTALQNLESSMQDILRDKQQDNTRKIFNAIRDSVGKVSKSSNLTAVFTTEIAVYADVDVTDDVIKDINK